MQTHHGHAQSRTLKPQLHPPRPLRPNHPLIPNPLALRHILPTTQTQTTGNKPSLEIRCKPGAISILIDQGQIETPYDSLSAQGFTADNIPEDSPNARKDTTLVIPVNGRRHLGLTSSHEESENCQGQDIVYLGNAILYTRSQLPTKTVTNGVNTDTNNTLSEISTAITNSQAPTRLNVRYAAELYSLAARVDDYKGLYPGWDLFNSQDLVVSSWADRPFYELDFGSTLGKPDGVRIPFYGQVDGWVVVLPPRRGLLLGGGEKVLECVAMLREDDMEFW
ncbi:hypothetical protein BDW59DRAFT_158399 [Aspergillus cavernicola]|uniref:Uncharacterized protein n=1 Tax=Aspergillus cavernicola TaxID=176166 RepID=A0ABR4IS40_9EURO